MLIAVEGIDGSGKGTQAKLLQEQLKSRGFSVGLLSFPRYQGTMFGRAVGEYLNGKFGTLDQVHPKLASTLYALDRWESLELIQANLLLHDVLICDRYTPSNVAHQCAKLEYEDAVNLQAWLDVLEYDRLKLPEANLTVHLDLPVESAVKLIASKAPRAYTDKKADLHEVDHAYLERVRKWYHQLKSWPRYRGRWMTVQVDFGQGAGIRSVDQVAADVLKAVDDVLKLKGKS